MIFKTMFVAAAIAHCAVVPARTKHLMADFEPIRYTGYSIVDGKRVDIPANYDVPATPGQDADYTTNPLDGSRARRVVANYAGRGPIEWGEHFCSFGMNGAYDEINGSDLLEFEVRPEGATRSLTIVLEELDKSRWSFALRIAPGATSATLVRAVVPLRAFGFDSSPAESTAVNLIIDPNSIRTMIFQGELAPRVGDGFTIDNVALTKSDGIAPASAMLKSPDVESSAVRLGYETTVTTLRFDIPADGFPVQQLAPLALVATGTTATAGTPPASGFTGDVWLSGPDRDVVDLPVSVRLTDGMVTIPVFVRRPGVYPVLAYEPRSGLETTLTLSAPERGGLRAEFGFDGIHGRQAIFVNQTLVPRLTLQGDPARMPLAAHIEMRDHTGRLVLADNQSVTDLANGKGRLAAPCQGLLTVDVALTAEPLSALPRNPAMPPAPDRPGKPPAPTPPMPAGVTTTTVAGTVMPLAELPTTATVLARDRFTLWALTLSPPENKLADSPFGINAGDLFAMTEAEAETSGQARLDWQRRVGAFHSRAALPWPAIEPRKGVYEFGRVQRVVDSHQNTFLKLLAVMGPAAAWAPAGAAPAAPDDLAAWRAYGRWMFSGYKTVPFFEVWDEPNGPVWKPAPDVAAYRRLLKETHEELTKWRGAPGKPGAGVLVAGSTAGWDSAFLEAVARDGGRDWFQVIAFHPWPAAPDKSPDANGLPARFDDMRALMRREGLLDKAAWVTALGWSTQPGGVTEDDQASYLARAYAMAIGGRMQRVYWSDMVDGGGRVPWRGGGGGHRGLMDSDMRPKPALTAYNLAAFMLAKVKPVPGTPTRQGPATVYSFDVMRQSYKYEGGRVHVAWTDDGPTTVTLDAIGGGPMSAVDALGAEFDPVQTAGPPPPRDGYEMLTYRLGSRVRGVRDAREAAAKAGKTAPAPTLEPPPGTAPDDEVCTRTFAVSVGRRPVYIWDVGLPEMDGNVPRNGLPR